MATRCGLFVGAIGLLLGVGCHLDNPAFDDPKAADGGGATGEGSSSGNEGMDGGSSSATGDGDGDGDTGPGDGDGDTGPGDGDGAPGDGDGEPPGDGDGEPPGDGDGDGDPPGDGDGDPPVCEFIAGPEPCPMCLADHCCTSELGDCLLLDDCACMVKCLATNANDQNKFTLCAEICAPGDDAVVLAELSTPCVLLNCPETCAL